VANCFATRVFTTIYFRWLILWLRVLATDFTHLATNFIGGSNAFFSSSDEIRYDEAILEFVDDYEEEHFKEKMWEFVEFDGGRGASSCYFHPVSVLWSSVKMFMFQNFQLVPP